jgi:preprotein translocase subunit SecA
LYKKIDSLEELIISKTEEVLNLILQQAFAVVKETAKRYAENDEVIVTATQNDKELAATKDFVRITDDNASYNTSWDAA